ncbi:MAG: TetR/AcrR family transcriptional regulator, partial [Polyangiaceae bacterium]
MQARNTEPLPSESRARLVEGFAAAVAEKGYAATTIADIAKHAHVSKRTFYEHFESKEDCLVETYTFVTKIIRQGIREAWAGADPKHWTEQLDAGLDAYVTALEAMPVLTRACLVEMAGAGPRALKARRVVHEKFALLLREFVDRVRALHPEVRTMSPATATAIVGGIDELLLAQVERGPQRKLSKVRDTASEMIRALLRD